MNQHHGQDEEPVVAGFEVPRSPDSSYGNVYAASEDDGKEPPMVPQHLQHTVLSYGEPSMPLPNPQQVVLNHLYIDNKTPPRSVVALGLSHRFRAKYVTVVLYKPVQRRASSSA